MTTTNGWIAKGDWVREERNEGLYVVSTLVRHGGQKHYDAQLSWFDGETFDDDAVVAILDAPPIPAPRNLTRELKRCEERLLRSVKACGYVHIDLAREALEHGDEDDEDEEPTGNGSGSVVH